MREESSICGTTVKTRKEEPMFFCFRVMPFLDISEKSASSCSKILSENYIVLLKIISYCSTDTALLIHSILSNQLITRELMAQINEG